MRDITARGYMVSRLEFGGLSGFHGDEMAAGRCFTPSEISSRYGLMEIGEIPSATSAEVERRCVAIYEKARSGYRGRHTGCCFPINGGEYTRSDSKCPSSTDIHIMHEWDEEIIKQGLDFRLPSAGGKAREKMGVNA